MVTLEQVRLLETKVAKAIEYINRVTDENALLKGTLGSYQKRIDELEVLVQRFKEDQGRIEEGIISALERLNQFEDAIEKSLSSPAGFPPPSPREAEEPRQSAPPPDAGEPLRSAPPPETEEAEAPEETGSDAELDIF
jgi:chromosome segregation ATPase